MKAQQLELEGRTISYLIQRSQRRKKTISIKVRHDQIKVLIPQRTTQAEVKALLTERGPWILQQQAKLLAQEAQRPAAKAFFEGESFEYLGQLLELQLVKQSLDRHHVDTYHREGKLFTPAASPDVIKANLRAWYYQQAALVFAERAAIYCTQMGLALPPLLVRNQRKRWGSCNSKGEIRLNWRLMQLPMVLLDYVLVHELAHLEHMNHAKAFWQRVADILPDYKDREEGLKSWAFVFETW